MMIAIRLEKELIKELDMFAKATHTNRSAVIRQAILHHLQELHDLEAFERTKGDRIYSLAEVEKRLGLAD